MTIHTPTHPMTNGDWESAKGVVCATCGRETFRIINGDCPQCYNGKKLAVAENFEKKATVRYFRRALNQGELTLGQARKGNPGHK